MIHSCDAGIGRPGQNSLSTAQAYTYDDFWRGYCGPHPARDALKSLIREDGQVKSPVLVWDEENVLIDGYTRDGIHAELAAEGISLPPIPVQRKSFSDRAEAEAYLLRTQAAARQMTPNRRAWRWASANADRIRACRKQAKENEKAGGRGEGLAHAPNVNVRKQLAEAAGVSEKVAGAVLKISDYLDETDHPKHAEFLAVSQAFERQEYTYRDVDEYFQRIEDERELARVRTEVLAEPLEQSGTIEGTVEGLVTGDWITVLKQVSEKTVDQTFTSPPYAIRGYCYNGKDANEGKSYAEYLAWLKDGFTEVFRVTKDGGRCAIQIDDVNAPDPKTGKSVTLPVSVDVVNLMRDIGWKYLYRVNWYKQHTSGKKGRVRWGSYADVTAPSIRRVSEEVLFFYKETPVHEGDKSLVTLLPDEFRNFTVSQWYVPPETEKFFSSKGVKHPCPFPIDLPYRAIQLLTRKTDVVLDPFSGTGTTALAAHCLGRRFIGIDLDPEFTEIGQRRLDEVAGLTPAERVEWLRKQLFAPSKGERKDGHGQSKHTGNNFHRRKRFRKPVGDHEAEKNEGEAEAA